MFLLSTLIIDFFFAEIVRKLLHRKDQNDLNVLVLFLS